MPGLGKQRKPVVQRDRRPFIRSSRRPFDSSLARDNAVAEGSSIQERNNARGFSPRRDSRTIRLVIMRIMPVGQIATIIQDNYPTVGPRGIKPARIFWVWENRGPAPGTIFPRSDGTGSDIGPRPDLARRRECTGRARHRQARGRRAGSVLWALIRNSQGVRAGQAFAPPPNVPSLRPPSIGVDRPRRAAPSLASGPWVCNQ
jgi:hypothetical protein